MEMYGFICFLGSRDFWAWFITAILLPFAVPFIAAYTALVFWFFSVDPQTSFCFADVSKKLIYDNGVYLFFATDLLLSLSYVKVKNAIPRWRKKKPFPFKRTLLEDAQEMSANELAPTPSGFLMAMLYALIISGTVVIFTHAFLKVYIPQTYEMKVNELLELIHSVDLASLAESVTICINVFLIAFTIVLAFAIVYRRYKRAQSFVIN